MCAPPTPSPKLAIISLGQHLRAEKEHQVAAVAEIGVQHAGLAGRKLCHVAEEYAIVASQIAFQKRTFRSHVDGHRPLARVPAFRRQGRGQVVGRAAERLARGTPVDAQHANCLPHGHHQIAMVVDVQRVALGAGFDRVVAGRFKAIGKARRSLAAGRHIDRLPGGAPAIDQQFDHLAVSRLAREAFQSDLEVDVAARYCNRFQRPQLRDGQVFRPRLAQVDDHQRSRLGQHFALAAETRSWPSRSVPAPNRPAACR